MKKLRHYCNRQSYNHKITAWKVSKYGVISGPYFPVFGLNTQIYEVNLIIQSKYRKIRTRNNSAFGHISRSECIKQQRNPELLLQVLLMWMNNIKFINHAAYLKSSACIIQELCDFYSYLSVILSQYHEMFEITDVTLRLSLYVQKPLFQRTFLI